MYEIKAKDMRGRVGVLKTNHGDVKTPNLMPVIHPRKQTIDVSKYGADIVITNAYLIYKDEDLSKEAVEKGLHELIHFDGPIMTDSGSFQLSVYGDVDITNKEVIEFQEAIGTDIGTSLDIPTAPYVDREKAEEDLEITLERAREAIGHVRENDFEMKINSVVQGSTYPDLREYCAEELTKLEADLYPIGAVVPLMEMYHYRDIVDAVMHSVKHLPDSKPRHLMGAGHPMIFALCVAMGCDLFDSAAYILYAEGERFLTTRGTIKLENMTEMPCSCEVCSKYTPDDLRAMDREKRVELIAQHNLHVSFGELRLIRQAISEGSLMELVEERCRAHPMLLDALRHLGSYSDDLEKYDPRSKKSAFFYTGPESLHRAEVTRHLAKLDEMDKKKNLVVLPAYRKPYSKFLSNSFKEFLVYSKDESEGEDAVCRISNEESDFMVCDIPFCLVPLELDEVYPLSQSDAPKIKDQIALDFARDFLIDFAENYDNVLIHPKVLDDLELDYIEEYGFSNEIKFDKDDVKKLKAIADYQFGHGAGNALFSGKIKIEKSKKTGKIRHVFDGNQNIVNMRASDSFLILSKLGAKRLAKLDGMRNKVMIDNSVESFARDGKSVFSKFILDCDENIRSNDEVLVVNEEGELLAFGKALLNHNEMLDFKTGQAIKTRKGFKKK
ncbi:tRNA guanosine(15) transglycosylase TgtA [uncultured Methanobrevibacter sp.]|uniref:tRNA guanosine(15) transglycosylase TgtA n=1 Tax=uncultured Methanobrevibacter sp. TaxID=253161 RepID=UPI0026201888